MDHPMKITVIDTPDSDEYRQMVVVSVRDKIIGISPSNDEVLGSSSSDHTRSMLSVWKLHSSSSNDNEYPRIREHEIKT